MIIIIICCLMYFPFIVCFHLLVNELLNELQDTVQDVKHMETPRIKVCLSHN